MNIAVVYSLPTRRAIASPYVATDEDTKDSAEEVFEALTQKEASPFMVPVSEDAIEKLRSVRADCIFNFIEWSGLDLPLSLRAFGILESLGIPITGATLTNFETTMDKVKMKESLDSNGLPTPRWQLFTTGAEPVRRDFQFPVIVKLAWEHCSVGLTHDAVVDEKDGLLANVAERIRLFGQPVYVEEFIVGREFQVTVLEKKNHPWVLPPAEIVFEKNTDVTFLTYDSRWNEKHPDYALSHVRIGKLSAKLRQAIETISRDSFTRVGFCDYSRLDIRTRGDEVFILEANANPGLGESDDYGMTLSYKAVGMTFADFVWAIVTSCLTRQKKLRSRKHF